MAGVLALPYPNTMNMWPQFRSPLLWDVFAVSTYATISVVFWYIGMIPDSGPCVIVRSLPWASTSSDCYRSVGAARSATGSV